ncbi:MAG TPA: DUF433 domain-containing protein [Tepidisphaeraceae bacterium]|jgi:uncharacterized protein (DUF433 family)
MSEAASTAEKNHVVCTPGTRGGKPRVAGTRICVQDIYQWHEIEGQSAEAIVKGFPHLTMGDVYAALAYFWDNRDQILADIKRQDQLFEEMKQRSPSKLREKLRARQGDDAVPP